MDNEHVSHRLSSNDREVDQFLTDDEERRSEQNERTVRYVSSLDCQKQLGELRRNYDAFV